MNARCFGRRAAILSRSSLTALVSLFAVREVSAAIMEVDSVGVITEFQNGVQVRTFDESAVNLFDTNAPPGGSSIEGPPVKQLTFGPAGDIISYNFSVPGFSTFSPTPESSPGLATASFDVGYDEANTNLSFNPISKSTYLSSSDPWALFFNGAAFSAIPNAIGICYLQFCSATPPGAPNETDYFVTFSGTIHEVPEPGTLGLMGLGLAGMVVAALRPGRRRTLMTGLGELGFLSRKRLSASAA